MQAFRCTLGITELADTEGIKRMFGTEPRAPMSAEERTEFEEHVSARHRACKFAALKAACLFGLNILCIVPFLAGHPLNRYWPIARYLLFTAMGLWVWLVLKVGALWASWQSARETRREFND
jgi:hypothetical protein